jgi:hypothetical protein
MAALAGTGTPLITVTEFVPATFTTETAMEFVPAATCVTSSLVTRRTVELAEELLATSVADDPVTVPTLPDADLRKTVELGDPMFGDAMGNYLSRNNRDLDAAPAAATVIELPDVLTVTLLPATTTGLPVIPLTLETGPYNEAAAVNPEISLVE